MFLYGTEATKQPFGNGFQCVGGSTWRLGPVIVGGGGAATFAVDYNTLPNPGGIQPGETWYWQFVYRDPVGGGTGWNSSDGLRATFCE